MNTNNTEQQVNKQSDIKQQITHLPIHEEQQHNSQSNNLSNSLEQDKLENVLASTVDLTQNKTVADSCLSSQISNTNNNDPLKRVAKTQMIGVKVSEGEDRISDKVEHKKSLDMKQKVYENKRQESVQNKRQERVCQIEQVHIQTVDMQKIQRLQQNRQIIQSVNESIVSKQISIHLDKDYFQIKTQQVQICYHQVKVQITQIKNKNFSISKAYQYGIVGYDKHGKFEIVRNIHEFESLRKLLIERWPGMFIPKILETQQTNQTVRSKHQCKNLEDFIIKLSYQQQLYYKQEVQLFLRSIGVDFEQMCSQMPVLRIHDIIQRYLDCFPDKSDELGLPQNGSTISKCAASLKRMSKHLEPMQKKFRKLAQSFEHYQVRFSKFGKFLHHYQQSCISNYTDDQKKLIALNDSCGKLNKLQYLQKQQNCFYDLYFMINSEIQDCQSLNQIILAVGIFEIKRDQLALQIKQTVHQIQQLKEGHKNIKMMTGRVTKQDLLVQLQGKQQRLNEQKNTLIKLIKIVQTVLATVTIPIFQKIKKETYFSVLKKNVQVMRDSNGELEEMWRYLVEEAKCQVQSL